ncbi:MAG TPA: hypothetical protein VIQ97_03425, partial [Prevotella sp.]
LYKNVQNAIKLSYRQKHFQPSEQLFSINAKRISLYHKCKRYLPIHNRFNHYFCTRFSHSPQTPQPTVAVSGTNRGIWRQQLPRLVPPNAAVANSLKHRGLQRHILTPLAIPMKNAEKRHFIGYFYPIVLRLFRHSVSLKNLLKQP